MQSNWEISLSILFHGFELKLPPEFLKLDSGAETPADNGKLIMEINAF
jgi:hypothetical protein